MSSINRQAIRALFAGVSDADLDEADQHLLILEQVFPNIAWHCKWQGHFEGTSKLNPDLLQAEVNRAGHWRMTIRFCGLTLATPRDRRLLRDCLAQAHEAFKPLADAVVTLSANPTGV